MAKNKVKSDLWDTLYYQHNLNIIPPEEIRLGTYHICSGHHMGRCYLRRSVGAPPPCAWRPAAAGRGQTAAGSPPRTRGSRRYLHTTCSCALLMCVLPASQNLPPPLQIIGYWQLHIGLMGHFLGFYFWASAGAWNLMNWKNKLNCVKWSAAAPLQWWMKTFKWHNLLVIAKLNCWEERSSELSIHHLQMWAD